MYDPLETQTYVALAWWCPREMIPYSRDDVIHSGMGVPPGYRSPSYRNHLLRIAHMSCRMLQIIVPIPRHYIILTRRMLTELSDNTTISKTRAVNFIHCAKCFICCRKLALLALAEHHWLSWRTIRIALSSTTVRYM